MKDADIVVTAWGARFMGRQFPCSIGRGGIVPARKKREGDGATPVGEHRLVGMLYNPARLARPADWALPVSHADRWSDDPRDAAYNTMVRMPHGFGHERLWRADPLYDLILLTDWNWPMAVPGRGSAIFVHRWRRPRFPTAGCVAFAREDLLWMAPRIRHETRLIVRG
ncbi:MAG: L,D-transpeptidase family protein [Cypionkella sp.]|nr:L,D-transpeptidase family protein [Cypionkella sp.]